MAATDFLLNKSGEHTVTILMLQSLERAQKRGGMLLPSDVTAARRRATLALLLMFFLVNLPALRWTDFSDASEAVNVATAMELKHDHHWKLPTLNGIPRIVKPPLTAWITAAMISQESLDALDSPQHDKAYHSLALRVRLPAMLSACVLLIGAYGIGLAVADRRLALAGAALTATNLLFLRHSQTNETDIHLAAWVTATNGLLAWWMLRGSAKALVLAGVTLGIAIMAKGPIAILQTVVPVAVFAIYRRRFGNENQLQIANCKLQIGLAALVAVVIGFWWFAWVGFTTPGVWGLWIREVTRHHANNLSPVPWYRYFTSFEFFFPWVIFIVVGLIDGIGALVRRTLTRTTLPLLMFLVPFCVMILFPERKERYLVPMIAPLAIVAANALLRAIDRRDKPLLIAQWGVIVFFALAMPIIGGTGLLASMRTPSGGSAWSGTTMIILCAISLSIVIAGMVSRRLIATAVIVMLAHHALYNWADSLSIGGASGMKAPAEELRKIAPDADYLAAYPSGPYETAFPDPGILEIYVNRTVRWTDDLKLPPPLDGNRVWLLFRKKNDPITSPLNSRRILEVPRSGKYWGFFLEDKTHQ